MPSDSASEPMERPSGGGDRTTVGYGECRLCGHHCGVDRRAERGRCDAPAGPIVAALVLHRGEEPPLGGDRGTGNVFFSRCSLGCDFCQNHEISQGPRGQQLDEHQLADALLDLQARGAPTLGLVTPTHFTPSVAASLRIARGAGLTAPVVHNGSAVDTPEALALLDGLVDVYLPDLKWGRARDAARYSRAPWYPEVAREAIRHMVGQVGDLVLDDDGIARRGLIVRHLVLPDDAAGSLDLLAWLADDIGPCALSLLRQYTPLHRAAHDPRFGRPISPTEYDEVLDAAHWLGFSPIYTQQEGCTHTGIPDWSHPKIFHW